MDIERHLLRLTRIGLNEEHAAAAKPHVRYFHGDRHAVEHDDLVAPVELVKCRQARRLTGYTPPPQRCRVTPQALCIPLHRTIAGVIAEVAKLLEDPDQCQTRAAACRLSSIAAYPVSRARIQTKQAQ